MFDGFHAWEFECAWKCRDIEECTHWGVRQENEYNDDRELCHLWTNVTGRKFNEKFSLSGNKACSLGTLGVGKILIVSK